MIRKIFSFILLTAFLFNSMGNFVIFEIRKKMLHEEIRTQNPSRSKKVCILSHILTSDDKNFHWFGKNEIIYMGNLYDVIREVRNGVFSTFYCIQDINEEILIRAFQKVNKDKNLVTLLDHLIKNALLKKPFEFVEFSTISSEFSSFTWTVNTWIHPPVNPPPEVNLWFVSNSG